ncbi:hypothetical protein Desor_4449 [Desulfosporosinus orientis DSM 765]|uniref:Flagellar hook-length control protein FliK n=1 Tax=Desulfosporosinus orientis (strain ATCC 19365 / DSM 765 / NCIMB 8382 / VKM B-1628 / Singapore I) TaxID=768706 RepID=G7W706_DESOD|nr:hypothetical protein [Desulfosporosinus orientis]AET69863.1 hypothetical protein Desor_4449 [Desulfosporosinus orientis DSM 765]
MQIGSIPNAIVAMPGKDLFQIGQKIIIQMLSQVEDGNASILVNGKSVQAFLDFEAKPGDKFQAVVKSFVNNMLVLSRDTESQKLIIAMPGKDTFQIGQKIIIQMLSQVEDGNASILANGKPVQAFLDFEAKSGDKFQAVVKNFVDNTLVLSRDTEVQKPIAAMPGKDTFQIGQKIIVEMLSQVEDGNASILVNGKSVQAFLDFEAKPGDKFQAVVKSFVNNMLVLSRDTESQKLIIAMPGKDTFQIGQKIIVEMLSQAEDGNASILASGKPVQAFLDFEAKPGDKFQAVVKNLLNNMLVLSRDTEVQNTVLANRGLPDNELFVYLLNDAQTASYPEILKNSDLPEELVKKFKDLIPNLKGLSKQETAGQLKSFLKQLGINYEHRLFDILIKGQGGDSEKLAQLKDTLKAQLLSLTNTHPSSSVINQLLDKITGQQLWHDTGVDGNGYMLAEIPIRQDQEIKSIKLAIQGSRKNGKLDPNHCRIALQTETPNLGPIGIDAFFSMNQLSLSLLTKNPDTLSVLIDGLMTEAKNNFQMIGVNLTSIHLKPLDNSGFHTLLKGEAKNGVDVLT